MNDGDKTNSILTIFSTSIPIGLREVRVYDIYILNNDESFKYS